MKKRLAGVNGFAAMRFRNLLSAIIMMLLAGRAVQATDLYSSGAKTWDTTTATWGTAAAGPYNTATWNNANNDMAVFVGTAGAVTLGEAISVGGLLFNSTGYTVSNSTYTLTFGAADNTIILNNVAAATITGTVGGSGNVRLTAANSATAGTVTFSGTSTGGWSGSTTVNPGVRLEMTGNANNQVLLNTSDIYLYGGTIAMGSGTTAIGTRINRINDSAPINSYGGTLEWSVNQSGTTTETNGTLNLIRGQFNFVETYSLSSGYQIYTLSGLSRTGANNTSVASLQAKNTGFSTSGGQQMIVGGVGANTPAGQIAGGPWLTTLYSNLASADYMVYTNGGSGTTFYAIPAAIAGSGQASWGTATDTYTQSSALETLGGTRTITALRNTGATATTALGANNLETYGLLNGASTLWTVSGSGSVRQQGTAAANLYVTAAAGDITINAPINDNTGALTLVKSGGKTLTLSSTASTYSGGTVLNAGTLVYSADGNLGASGSRNITFNGAATLTWGFDTSSLGTLTLNAGAVGNLSSINTITFATTTGSGTVRASGGQNKTVSLGDASTFTGDVVLAYNANNNSNFGTPHLSFSKLNDAVGSSIQFYRIGGGTDSGQQGQIGLTGNAGALTLDNRQIQLLPKTGGSGQNMKDVVLLNNNGTPANKWVINTPLLNSYDRDPTFYLAGSNAGDNTFAGTIGDSTYGGPFSSGSGRLSLIKAGAGTWVISNTNTYSGATSVTAGKLYGVVGGSCSNSAVIVSAGTFGISVTDTTKQWACAGLTHSAASTLEFAFGGNTPSTSVAPLQVNGNVVFAVAPTVSCTGSSLPAGTYPLMTWTGSFFGVAPLSPALPSGVIGLLVVDNATKTLWLSVSASGSSKQPLTWKGPAGSTWVANEAVYSKWQDATPVNTNYQETTVNGITVGDNVVFGNTGAGTVTLNSTVSPASMQVNSTANYTFSGTGSIVGPGGLTKANSASLTLSTTNTYSGGTLLSAGTLSIAADNVLGTGHVVLGGGTLQSSDATARTLNNPVVLNGSTTVGGTGSLTFNNSGTGTVVAASTITVSSSAVNATFDTSFGGAGSITKAGAGTMTLTGTNTYAGTTTVSAGTFVVDGGQIANNAAVSVSGSSIVITNGASVFSGGAPSAIGSSGSSSMKVVGGSGATSFWDLGNQHLGVGNTGAGTTSFVIDGAGVAGSAVVTNINILQWGTQAGFSTANTSIILTNGGQMFVNGVIRLGSTYYGTYNNTNNSITIMGGAADSTFVGNNQSFYVGIGDRYNSKYNNVTVGTGGVLTNVGTFYVGDSENTQGVAGAPQSSYFNQLVVADGGKAFLRSDLNVGYATVYTASNNTVLVSNGGSLNVPGIMTVGYANAANTKGICNSVTITNGGQFYTGADSMIGRAANASAIVDNNMALISGANSLWNLGNKNLFVGAGSGVATGNVLSVTAGGVATNISALIVKAANTLSLGAGGQIYAGAMTNAGTLAVALDKNVTPVCGRLSVAGNLNVSNAKLDVSLSGTPIGAYVIASYESRTGTFAATNGLPDKYKLEMDYKGNQIAIVYAAAGTMITFQ